MKSHLQIDAKTLEEIYIRAVNYLKETTIDTPDTLTEISAYVFWIARLKPFSIISPDDQRYIRFPFNEMVAYFSGMSLIEIINKEAMENLTIQERENIREESLILRNRVIFSEHDFIRYLRYGNSDLEAIRMILLGFIPSGLLPYYVDTSETTPHKTYPEIVEPRQRKKEISTRGARLVSVVYEAESPELKHMPLPISIYISRVDNNSEKLLSQFTKSLLSELDFKFDTSEIEIKGSIFKRIWANTIEFISSVGFRDKMENLEVALRKKYIDAPDSENLGRYTLAAKIGADILNDQDIGAIQIGPLVVVKFIDEAGRSVKLVKLLTSEQLIRLESEPTLITDPRLLLKAIGESPT